jgi:hypothetical protein
MSEKLEDKLTTLVSLAFDAHQQAAKLGVDYETVRYIFDAYDLLIAAGLDEQGNRRTFN